MSISTCANPTELLLCCMNMINISSLCTRKHFHDVHLPGLDILTDFSRMSLLPPPPRQCKTTCNRAQRPCKICAESERCNRAVHLFPVCHSKIQVDGFHLQSS